MPTRQRPSHTTSETSSLLSANSRRHIPKSDIDITIHNHFKTKIYTSSSPLSGEVTITTQRDVRFDSIEIILLGSSKTQTEGYSAPHESRHTFLKMAMPVPESTYPVPCILESGRTWTIPFNFVLPNFLTLSACNHKIQSDHVRDQHLCLPPSMGFWARGNRERDDMAPHMAEVEYSVKARVWRESDTQGRPVKVMEAAKPIQVLPASPEAAPLGITKNGELYKMYKSKTIRKNLITSKIGRLTVSGQQPRAVILQPDGKVAAGSTAHVDVKFEPVSPGVQPPKITGISTKIKAHTFYSANAITCNPTSDNWATAGLTERRGMYSASVTLPATAPPPQNPWITYQGRRDSGYQSDTAPEISSSGSSASDDSSSEESSTIKKQKRQHKSTISLANLVGRPSTAKQTSSSSSSLSLSSSSSSSRPPRRPSTSPVYHTTSLHIPIDLPTGKKAFVPTFHSCILSRVYTLHVSMTVAAGPTASTTLSLDLPLQIAVETVGPQHEDTEVLPSFEDAVEEAAADEFLRPRVLGVPGAEFQERSSVLPAYGAR